MKQTASSSPENTAYNDELTLLDGLYAFHPDIFDTLDPQELQALKAYYLTGEDVPENIFEYRVKLVERTPEVSQAARAAFIKVRRAAGIK